MIFHIVNEQVRQNCIKEIEGLPLGLFKIDISEIKRSCPQNRFYWAITTIIAKELGFTIEELHDAFKSQFIGMENGKDIFGNLYIRPKSSAKLKKRKFTEYVNKVQAFAYSQNIILPTKDYYGIN
jgi:hypothetical protein